ncbi:chaperonin 10-like protein [Fusarium tricinctum]|uniref:Chaperonin 10-like protein n=1 Tax=Fusarium tricinctum TaxID=61284 RepID=A0A8K0WE71_9HYPO|nr:chaperonin 10-like protein [Fusarium tricinctum]
MKSAFFDKHLRVEVRDVPIPVPAPGQILIRTVVSGTNPKDWKYPKLWASDREASNHGDDIAGYVEAVGDGVVGFHPGDRVAAFHEMATPHGSYAEYSIAWAKSTFHVSANVSFEEAATIPLAAMTAALGLYQRLGLPLPWNPATTPLPLIVYGGATAVGSYAIKLAKFSNIHPIISVAGNSTAYVESLLDKTKGDVVIDYRKGNNHVVEEIRKAAGSSVIYALDAVSEKGSITNIGKALAEGGKVATVLTPEMSIHGNEDPGNAEILFTMVGTVHQDTSPTAQAVGAKFGDREFGAVFFHYFGLGLTEGWFNGHPYEVVEGGLDGLENALRVLEEGKLSAKKLVLRIADTKGLGKA